MGAASSGRLAIRAGFDQMKGLWDCFVQTVHPGAVAGVSTTKTDAVGRAHVSEACVGTRDLHRTSAAPP
jgi:hypothetical protein